MFKKRNIIIAIFTSSLLIYILVGSFLFKVKASEKKTYEALITFQRVYQIALDEYVDPVNPDKLIMGSLKGLLESVDGYSAYFTKKEYDFIMSKKDKKGNVGIVLSPHMGYYKIMTIIPDSPAAKSGLLVGDTIAEINNKGISEYDYLYANSILKGDMGSKIKIGVQRGSDEEDLFEVVLKRDKVKPEIASSKILNGNIGYLKIFAILPDSKETVKKEILNLKKKGIKKLILDLREAYGNGYEDAIAISDFFLKKGTITFLKGKSFKEKKFTATPKTLFDGKLVVITNGTTWQAPEILVSSLKYNKRAKVIGFKTFGGAAIQKFIPTEDGNYIYLTYGVYCDPDGKTIMSKKYRNSGVRPNLKYPPEEFAMDLYSRYILGKGEIAVKYYKEYKKKVYEKQLEKALEILTSNKGKKAA